jgi:hypothetical protein
MSCFVGTCTLKTETGDRRTSPNNILPSLPSELCRTGGQHCCCSVVVAYNAVICKPPPITGSPIFDQTGPLARMTLHTRLLSTDDEQNTFARLVVRRSGSVAEMKEFPHLAPVGVRNAWPVIPRKMTGANTERVAGVALVQHVGTCSSWQMVGCPKQPSR